MVVTWQSFGTDRLRRLGRFPDPVGVDGPDSEDVGFPFLQTSDLQETTVTTVTTEAQRHRLRADVFIDSKTIKDEI